LLLGSYWHGTVSITDYLTWHATGCDQVKEEYPAKCHMLFAQIVLATGNLDGDDLYSNYCTGNRYTRTTDRGGDELLACCRVLSRAS
jgi:hypothetical protein